MRKTVLSRVVSLLLILGILQQPENPIAASPTPAVASTFNSEALSPMAIPFILYLHAHHTQNPFFSAILRSWFEIPSVSHSLHLWIAHPSSWITLSTVGLVGSAFLPSKPPLAPQPEQTSAKGPEKAATKYDRSTLEERVRNWKEFRYSILNVKLLNGQKGMESVGINTVVGNLVSLDFNYDQNDHSLNIRFPEKFMVHGLKDFELDTLFIEILHAHPDALKIRMNVIHQKYVWANTWLDVDPYLFPGRSIALGHTGAGRVVERTFNSSRLAEIINHATEPPGSSSGVTATTERPAWYPPTSLKLVNGRPEFATLRRGHLMMMNDQLVIYRKAIRNAGPDRKSHYWFTAVPSGETIVVHDKKVQATAVDVQSLLPETLETIARFLETNTPAPNPTTPSLDTLSTSMGDELQGAEEDRNAFHSLDLETPPLGLPSAPNADAPSEAANESIDLRDRYPWIPEEIVKLSNDRVIPGLLKPGHVVNFERRHVVVLERFRKDSDYYIRFAYRAEGVATTAVRPMIEFRKATAVLLNSLSDDVMSDFTALIKKDKAKDARAVLASESDIYSDGDEDDDEDARPRRVPVPIPSFVEMPLSTMSLDAFREAMSVVTSEMSIIEELVGLFVFHSTELDDFMDAVVKFDRYAPRTEDKIEKALQKALLRPVSTLPRALKTAA